jgi:hypothetical protein
VFVRAFALPVLFDFDPSSGLHVGAPKQECQDGLVWNEQAEECQTPLCLLDQVLVRRACVKELQEQTYDVVIKMFMNNTLEVYNNGSDLTQKVYAWLTTNSEVPHMVMDINTTVYASHQWIIGNVSIHDDNEYYTVLISIRFILVFNISQHNHETNAKYYTPLVDHYQAAISSTLKELIMSDLDIQVIRIYSGPRTNRKNEQVLDCIRTFLPNRTFSIVNDSVVRRKTGQVFSPDQFQWDKDGILVCVLSLPIEIEFSLAMSITTGVLTGLWLICLVIRLILQCCVCSFQNHNGRLQFNLCLALACSFSLFLMGPFLVNFQIPCIIFGIAMHWAFLTVFTWMNVISIDLFSVFRAKANFRLASDRSSHIVFPMLYGWLMPGIAVIPAIILDFQPNIPDIHFRPEYGSGLCWITKKYALLIFFVAPMALLMLINSFLFVVTSINICRTRHSGLVPSGIRRDAGIYGRLLVLMGITWLFGFVAPMVHNTALWFVFIALNASQGLLICIAFVFRGSVLRAAVSSMNTS